MRTRLERDDDIAALANACTVSVELDGRAVGAFGITSMRGSIEPTVLAGRVPRASDEVALGTKTLDTLRRKIGDLVSVRTRSGSAEFRVVGRVAVPALSDPQAVADGAVFNGAALSRLTNVEDTTSGQELLVRFRPGVDKTAAAARIRRMPGIGAFEEPGVVPVSAPLEVDRLDQIDRMPIVLGIFLAVVGMIAVGHLLVTSVRRRRRDFAVLKSVGFRRRQVLATVSWQATTVAVAGLLVGLVLGIVVGSLLWRAVADRVGVLPAVAVPTAALAAIAAATVVIANVIAAVPARSAARTKPAVALRSE
jgi:predicted lysophospholipase L1 biosynthesis ABC-type transport system permease subunit